MKSVLRNPIFLFVLFLVAATSFSKVTEIKAADGNIRITPDEKISVDFDGDGKNETLLMTRTDDENEYIAKFVIFINNKKVKSVVSDTTNDLDMRISFQVIDMTAYNGTKMLDIDGHLYSYGNGKLIELQNKTGLFLASFGNYSKKGYLIGKTYSSSFKLGFMCDSWETVPFKIYIKDNTLTMKKTLTYSLDTSYWEGTLSENIKLYKSKSTKSDSICTVREGTHVTVPKGYATKNFKVKIEGKTYKLFSTTWIYIVADNGMKGWYKPNIDNDSLNVWDEDGTLVPYFSFKPIFSDGKFAG